MTTYADCAARRGGTAVFVVEIRGIPWSPSDGLITAGNNATIWQSEHTIVPGLRMPEVVYARSIEPLQGSGQQGTFSLEFVDWKSDTYPDGFYTWMFGGDRSTIAKSRLTADVPHHAGGVGHNIGVEDASVFTAETPLYCGLETWECASLDTVDPDFLVSTYRSQYLSPCSSHNVDPSGVYPLVTDHPTRWLGRVLTLFQTYMDGDGYLATTGVEAADQIGTTAREAAFKMRGVIKSISHSGGVWTLSMDSLDVMLKRKAMRGMATARVGSRLFLDGGARVFGGAQVVWDFTATEVLFVNLGDPTGAANATNHWVSIANGSYSPSEFIAALNAALAASPVDTHGAATWYGTLTADLGHDSITWVYHSAGVGFERQCEVKIGFDVHIAGGERVNAREYIWDHLGVDQPDSVLLGEDADVVADTDYVNSYDVNPLERSVKLGRVGKTIPLEAGTGLATAADFTVGQAVVVQSDAAKAQPAWVAATFPATNRITLSNALGKVVHTGTEITIRSAYWSASGEIGGQFPAQSVLRVLLSTGLPFFNHASYDLELTGIGIEIPHETPMAGASDSESLIDVGSFERFFAEMAWSYDTMSDLLWEGTSVLEWLTQKLAFLGGWLVVRNGQIAVVRGLLALYSSTEATIDEGSLIEHSNTAGDDRLVIDGVSYECNWEFVVNEAKLEFTAQLGDGSADFGDNTVTFKDKGIQTDSDKLTRLAIDVLGDYSREPWRYKVTCDRLMWRVEPGAIVSFADEGTGDTTDDTRRYQGAPNPDGTRGFSGVKMLVLSSAMDVAGGTTTLELAHVRRKRSGWAAAAWISDYTNVGAAVLYCDDNVFRPTVDGFDVSAFTVGDKVRIVSVNPTQAGAEPGVETGEASLTIASISAVAGACEITLTGLLAVAWPSPAAAATQCYVLVLDKYETASQTTTAQNWCWIGDASGDIDDGGDACYEW